MSTAAGVDTAPTPARPRSRGIAVLVVGLLLAPLIAVVAATPAEAFTRPADSTTVLRILRDTNKVRAEVGLKPLYRMSAIDTVARTWSGKQAAAGKMSHNPDFASQIPAGWTRAGENVAYGYDPTTTTNGYITVVDAWKKSSGHLANMRGDYTDIGIGVAYGSDGWPYYTQNFGKYSASKSASSTAATPVQLDGQTVDSRTGLPMAVASPPPSTSPSPSPSTSPSSPPAGPGTGDVSTTGSRHDFDGDGASDVIVWTPAGALLDYRADGYGNWNGRRTIGSGWSTMRFVTITKDFDGDGRVDVLAVKPDGTFWLYRGNGSGGWLGSKKVGTGWGTMRQVLAVDDLDGDGHPDVVAVRGDGSLWLYRGDGAGGWLGWRKIGSGWGGFTSVLSAGDFDGDGNPDLIARTSSGALLLYRGNGAASWLGMTAIGSGWNGFRSVTAVGDFDGDGNPDVVASTSAGALYLYPGNGTGSWKAARLIGTGWGSFGFVR